MAANRVVVLRATHVLAMFAITQFFGSAFPELDEQIHTTFLPNERESVDDCHLRYYKYGVNSFRLPANGRPAVLREFAHIAAVGWTNSIGHIKWNCGGTLIWENYVLTAAHCAADDRNEEPDVVRLGDINVYSDTDDQYAQQFRIIDIIRHPEHRFSSSYHDLALLRLEKNVVLHDTVAPACLWNDETIPFPTMETAGWGATGFRKDSTPILLKVSLGVVPKQECDKHYRAGSIRFRQGLQNYHLCAVDSLMDTCQGDSGGPLQMKLLHSSKMTPFVVAVTSFGMPCGLAAPGVYMKVSSYIPWMRREMKKRGEKIEEWSFKPYACVVRYAYLREYEDKVIQGKSHGYESTDFRKASIRMSYSLQTVKINWPSGLMGPENCYGVVIDEDTIVTLARCAVFERIPVSNIEHQGIRNDVVKVYQHPLYRSNSFYNDIAVLKVKNRFKFSRMFNPPCIWSAFELPETNLYVSGHGRLDLNLKSDHVLNKFEPEMVPLTTRADIKSLDNCSVSERYLSSLSRGLPQEFLCFGNKLFLVPEACQLRIGGPVRNKIWRMDREFDHVYGLNLLGEDCGFGSSAVANRLGFHIEWLNSILLPNYRDTDAVYFFSTDLHEYDPCFAVDGRDGLCVNVTRCPKIANDIKANRNARFCSTGYIVCCPYSNIVNQTSVSNEADELDNCENTYIMFHAQFKQMFGQIIQNIDQFPHTVWIGWQIDGLTLWHCSGTLITRNLVVSSASCLASQGTSPTLVNIGEGHPTDATMHHEEVRIETVVVHPGFSLQTSQHNIGLVRLEKNIIPTALKYPICLWQNKTHIPFLLHRMDLSGGIAHFAATYPRYNSDCQAYLKETGAGKLYSTQLCTEKDINDPRALRKDSADNEGLSTSGAPVVWHHYDTENNTTMQYLVALVSYIRDDVQLVVNTRIESYRSWIKSFISAHRKG